MKLTSLRTPCVLIDEPRVEHNIDRMQQLARVRGLALRPHAKTHKSPELALLQIAHGAAGICCAKLGEAEVFADRGIENIRLPYPLNPVNADRVLALLERTHLSFIVDDLEVAQGWSRAMNQAGREVDVLVKVDVGFHRCGIDPAKGAADFVARVSELPGLRLKGLLSHAGHGYAARSEDELAQIARAEAEMLSALETAASGAGVSIEEISVGATPTARYSAQLPGLTELRPGNYIFYDRTQVGLGAAAWTDCALTVLSRVVSRPAADRVILDAGSKTLTNDLARGFNGVQTGYGVVLESLESPAPDESLNVERLSEEHATVRTSGHSPLRPGDLVRIVPNHACVVTNMVDEAWLVRGDEVLDKLSIAARGRIE